MLADCVGDLIAHDTVHVASTGMHNQIEGYSYILLRRIRLSSERYDREHERAFLMTISFLVTVIAQVLILILIARAILSWLPRIGVLTPVATLLDGITEPILSPIRRRLPFFGGLDLSPLVALLLISVGEALVLTLLAGH